MRTGLESVSVGYDRRPVLKNIDVSIPTGVVGLLGANGAGKTTLLRLLATQLSPHSGSVYLAGRRLTDRRAIRAARGEVGFLPQSWGYYRGFSVRDFVGYCAALRGLRSRAIPAEVDYAIASVDLSGSAGTLMRKLSGGQRQRAGIAATIVGRPPVVLLDEPTVGLDPEQRLEFRRLLVRLAEETGGTVLLSTHLVEDIAQIAAHVIVIDDGHVCFTGTTTELADLGEIDPRGDTPIESGYLVARGRRASVVTS
ncbi:ABC-type multidrug transport system ATPase subunit [Stackebrandtia endophytica]|uniref:ABC-type multidrug transport system ATPase subunit n=1 Tax=Stackebrandtia endophytica TaxID=1496996 RepID=A0A543AYH4_9ACTN|nr:ATP-binding cassette domain-containing protein [Stackebrandtia endophytica]TQL77623.1 ABC-type multidrug transport system ATPase subunit [Stackebrandtia endophytica]